MKLDKEDKDHLWNTLNAKWKLMDSDAHCGIYCIDPRFGDSSLDYDDIKRGEKWLAKKAGDKWKGNFSKIYDDYVDKKEPFDGEEWNLTPDDDPAQPYRRLRRANGLKEWAEFCIKYLDVNGSCVKLESSFKVVRVVHNQWRRSLAPDLLAQLVYDYFNIRALEKYRSKPLL